MRAAHRVRPLRYLIGADKLGYARAQAHIQRMTEEEPLNREERLRRVAKVCVHFARNMAYYRAARDGDEWITPAGSNFWNTTTANFIDTAVLEWCKVFADKNERQHWRKVVSDAAGFEAGMLAAVGADAVAFEAVIDATRVYRDKFLAHLDSKRVMDIPRLDALWAAARFCFRHVLDKEMTDAEAARIGLPDLDAYYRDCLDEARPIYERARKHG